MVVWTGHVSLVWKLGLGVAEEFVRRVPAALEGLVSLSDWCWAMQAFNEEVEWELSALRCGWCRPAFRRDKVPSDSDMAKIATNLCLVQAQVLMLTPCNKSALPPCAAVNSLVCRTSAHAQTRRGAMRTPIHSTQTGFLEI